MFLARIAAILAAASATLSSLASFWSCFLNLGSETFLVLAGIVIEVTAANVAELRAARDASDVYCPDAGTSARIVDHIHRAKVEQDTVGGRVEAHVLGVPPGLGTCVQWDERLDSRIAAAVMGIQAFKAVAPNIAKFFLQNFSDVQFYLGPSFDSSTMVFSIYGEGAVTPNFYFIMGGLIQEKF